MMVTRWWTRTVHFGICSTRSRSKVVVSVDTRLPGGQEKSSRFRLQTGLLQARVSSLRKELRKTLFTKNYEDEIETSAHHFERHRTYHRESVLVATVVTNVDTWRESVRIKQQRTTPRHQRKFLHARRRLCTAANLWTESEADWDASNDELERRDDTSTPKHHNIVGVILAQLVA